MRRNSWTSSIPAMVSLAWQLPSDTESPCLQLRCTPMLCRSWSWPSTTTKIPKTQLSRRRSGGIPCHIAPNRRNIGRSTPRAARPASGNGLEYPALMMPLPDPPNSSPDLLGLQGRRIRIFSAGVLRRRCVEAGCPARRVPGLWCDVGAPMSCTPPVHNVTKSALRATHPERSRAPSYT